MIALMLFFAKILALDISFSANAYTFFDFFDYTFHTLPKPPLPTTYYFSKLFFESKSSTFWISQADPFGFYFKS